MHCTASARSADPFGISSLSIVMRMLRSSVAAVPPASVVSEAASSTLPLADAASCFGVAPAIARFVERLTRPPWKWPPPDRATSSASTESDFASKATSTRGAAPGASARLVRPRTRPPATANSTSSSATRPALDAKRACTEDSGGVSGSRRLSVLSSTSRSTPGTAASGSGVSAKRGSGAFARAGSAALRVDAGASFVRSIDFEVSAASTRGRGAAVLRVIRPSTVWPAIDTCSGSARSDRPAYCIRVRRASGIGTRAPSGPRAASVAAVASSADTSATTVPARAPAPIAPLAETVAPSPARRRSNGQSSLPSSRIAPWPTRPSTFQRCRPTASARATSIPLSSLRRSRVSIVSFCAADLLPSR